MRYTLTIINHAGEIVVQLSYKDYNVVQSTVIGLRHGVAETFTYKIEIHDTYENCIVYQHNTY